MIQISYRILSNKQTINVLADEIFNIHAKDLANLSMKWLILIYCTKFDIYFFNNTCTCIILLDFCFISPNFVYVMYHMSLIFLGIL